MSMDVVNFVFGALTGVAGNTVYDGIKLIFGSTFSRLETLAQADEKEKFVVHKCHCDDRWVYEVH